MKKRTSASAVDLVALLQTLTDGHSVDIAENGALRIAYKPGTEESEKRTEGSPTPPEGMNELAQRLEEARIDHSTHPEAGVLLIGREQPNLNQKLLSAVETKRREELRVDSLPDSFEQKQKERSTRLIFNASDEDAAQLKDLQTKTGCTTSEELLSSSIVLLQWASEQVASGRDIVSMNNADKTYKVLKEPFLDRIKAARNPSQSHVERAAGSKPSSNALGE